MMKENKKITQGKFIMCVFSFYGSFFAFFAPLRFIHKGK